jgi:endo-1,4-beta-mannosidase
MPKFLVRAAVIVALLVLVMALRSLHRAPNGPIPSDVPVAPKPLPACTDAEIEAAFDALPEYQPSGLADFVRVQSGRLMAGDEPFLVRGVNYYPSRYPWRRFLTQTDAATVDTDFALFRSVEFNTLRIFLWNEALFACPGSGAVPVADAFLRLDDIVQKAAEYNLRLIVTLNDLPDLTDYPLYDNPPHVLAQTRFIVERYRDEAVILAWDLRNEGDIDYDRGPFTRDTVLGWLDETSTLVRSLDGNHLITAGWLRDSEATVPYVDLVSFHHWSGVPQVISRIAALQKATDKPVLLQEFGYSTQKIDLVAQATLIGEVIHAVEQANTAGWLIWTAFDFPTDATCTPPNCPSVDNAEHHFGLWSTDYTPKPAVSVLMP